MGMNYKRFLSDASHNNTCLLDNTRGQYTVTWDKVWLPSTSELINESVLNLNQDYPTHTDYAALCGLTLPVYITRTGSHNNLEKLVMVVASGHSIATETALANSNNANGICPRIRLGYETREQLEQDKTSSDPYFNIRHKDDKHYISFGEYPQDKVPPLQHSNLWSLKTAGKLIPTGKKYLGYIDNTTNQPVFNDEYINPKTGLKYVLARHNKDRKKFMLYNIPNSILKFSTNEEITEKEYWIEVKPLEFEITNWDSFNLNKMHCLELKSTRIIQSLPFSIQKGPLEIYDTYWINSFARGYLNGLDLTNVQDAGTPLVRLNMNFADAKMPNFLREAFEINEPVMENSTTVDNLKEYITHKKSRLASINPDTTPKEKLRPMTDTEKIKTWIDNGESVLLRGPSGIGKTERIRREYGDRCIYLKLTNNMFPEKVVGSVNLQTGQEVPPNYAKEAILACATPEERKQVLDNIQNIYDIADDIYNRSNESDEKIVILLDELLNVKPAVQSLVYTLVLNRFVENGKGLKLPKNVVVVATGNQKKYSSVAEDLAEPLEKRFDHILDMEPKVNEWLYEYAIPNSLHPSVINYISSKQMESRKEDISYFYEEPEVAEKKLDKNGCKGKTNDPRGWSSISQMLYNFERNVQSGKYIGKDIEDLLKTSLSTKLREEWAEEFFDFYNNPTISVEDIMNDAYVKEDLPKTINEKFATTAGLLSADLDQVEKIREFIRKYCSPEHREVFDLTWANGDVDRMQKIIELKSKEQTHHTVEKQEDSAPTPASTNTDNPITYAVKKISITDFFNSKNKYIECEDKFQAEILKNSSPKFKVDSDEWSLRNKYLSSKGCFTEKPKLNNSNLYKFNEIDFSEVYKQHTCKLLDDKYNGITLEDFMTKSEPVAVELANKEIAKLFDYAILQYLIETEQYNNSFNSDIKNKQYPLYFIKKGYTDKKPQGYTIYPASTVNIDNYLELEQHIKKYRSEIYAAIQRQDNQQTM